VAALADALGVDIPAHLRDGCKESAEKLMRHPHPTVKLRCPLFDGEPIEVDKLLAPLMPLIWAKGIPTFQCCQEADPGLAQIEFPDTQSVEAFLTVAQREYKVEISTHDYGKRRGKHLYRVWLFVRFPTMDIPRLVEAFS
jgi:hypothetical protein